MSLQLCYAIIFKQENAFRYGQFSPQIFHLFVFIFLANEGTENVN